MSGVVAARPGIAPGPLTPQAKSLTTTPHCPWFFSGILANRCLASSATVIVGPMYRLVTLRFLV